LRKLLRAAAREGKKMLDAKSLAEALEKPTMFLTSKADGSTTGVVVPQEVVKKLVLLTNDLKLEGVANYLSWSRRAILVVEQKDLDGHLLGTLVNHETRLVQRERSGRLIRPFCITILYHDLLLFIDIFHY
jgi:hypothetical protein